MRLRMIPVILCLGLIQAGLRAEEYGSLPGAFPRELSRAYYGGDTSAMLDLETRLAGIERKGLTESESALLSLYRGFARNFFGRWWQERDDDRAKGALKEAEGFLLRAAELRPGAEVYALLADCAGSGMRYTSIFGVIGQGRKAGDYLERAQRADSLNPRVAMVEGVSLIYRPAAFGGGADRARLKLYRAIELRRARNEPDSLAPDWGREEEIYAWLAILETREGNLERAREFAGIAERLQPGYWFVERNVLPELERAERKR